MSKPKKTKTTKIPKRSGVAQAALARRAPTMDHRLEPRGGANTSITRPPVSWVSFFMSDSTMVIRRGIAAQPFCITKLSAALNCRRP